MSKRGDEKAAEERSRFMEFVAVTRLPLIPGSLQSTDAPAPDLICELEDRGTGYGGLVAFEVVGLTNRDLKENVEAPARRGRSNGAFHEERPAFEFIRQKCTGKTYQTPHPVELLAWGGDDCPIELLEPADLRVTQQIRRLIGVSPFRRIWIVRLTRKDKGLWLRVDR